MIDFLELNPGSIPSIRAENHALEMFREPDSAFFTW